MDHKKLGALPFLGVALESFFFPIPLVVLASVILFFYEKSARSLWWIFLASLLLDSMRASSFGATAVFIFMVIVFFLLYEKLFEMKGYYLVGVLSVMFLFLYAYLFSYEVVYIFYGIIVFLVGYSFYRVVCARRSL